MRLVKKPRECTRAFGFLHNAEVTACKAGRYGNYTNVNATFQGTSAGSAR